MSLHHMLRAAAGNTAGPSDPYFEYNTLLLSGDGTNGAQNNTFLDSSTNNFTITRNGNTTQGTFSPYGPNWSNYFDGSGDYLTAPNNTAFDFGSGNFTIEMWVSPTSSAATYNSLWGKRSSASVFTPIQVGLVLSGGVYKTYFAGSLNGTSFGINGSFTPGSITVPLNAWTHIAVVRNGTTFTSYVNGVQDFVVSSISGALTTNSYDQAIGASATNGAEAFTGYISNCRAVKGTALYTSNFTPSTAPLTAISGTSLLTCQSNRFKDNSSNNFAITVAGNTSVQRFSPFNPTAPYSTSTIGGSGYFDGTGDSLTLADNAAFDVGTGDFTIECWVYHTTSTGTNMYIEHSYGGFALYRDGDKLNFAQADIANLATSSNSIPVNAWTHVAVSRSGTSLKLWVNGVLGATVTNSTNLTSTDTVKIATSTGALYMLGYISNLRVVKGTAVYTTAFTPPTSPVTAVSGTSLLCNMTNAGIPDAAMMNDLETVGNAQVSTSVKKYGTGSLYFDGTGDWLTAIDSPNLKLQSGDFTVEAWIYPTGGAGNWRGCISKGSSTGDWALGISQANLFFWSDNTTNYSSTTSVSLNTWYHVAVVRSGTTVKMYVNGVAEMTQTISTNYQLNNPLYVGCGRTADIPFTGYIDDLRITKGYARYTTNFTPPTAALPLY